MREQDAVSVKCPFCNGAAVTMTGVTDVTPRGSQRELYLEFLCLLGCNSEFALVFRNAGNQVNMYVKRGAYSVHED